MILYSYIVRVFFFLNYWLNLFKTHCILFASTCTARRGQVIFHCLPRFEIPSCIRATIHDSKYGTTRVLFASTYTAKQLKTMYYSLNNAQRIGRGTHNTRVRIDLETDQRSKQMTVVGK